MIEITSNCNAMCLDCGEIDGKLNPNLKFDAGNMKLKYLKKYLIQQFWSNLAKYILMETLVIA